MNSTDAPEEKPNEQPSQIRLFFVRHGETPGVKDAQGKDVSVPDAERRVSAASKADAIKKGQSKKLNDELMRVETSPRIRTSESAL